MIVLVPVWITTNRNDEYILIDKQGYRRQNRYRKRKQRNVIINDVADYARHIGITTSSISKHVRRERESEREKERETEIERERRR